MFSNIFIIFVTLFIKGGFIMRQQFLRKLTLATLSITLIANTLNFRSFVSAEETNKPAEKMIRQVEKMPSLPESFKILDWKTLAKNYDSFIFDFQKEGQYLPTIWLDKTHHNMNKDSFGLYSYIGKNSQGSDGSQEAINAMAAVLSATLVGIDKSNQNNHDYVEMLQTYYNKENKENVILNNPKTVSGQSFWYEIFPHILFYQLAYYYPNVNNMEAIMKDTADRWYDAVMSLGGMDKDVDFNYTAFDFKNMQPMNNEKWIEPDAAAGVALIQYYAYKKFGDKKYLEATKLCMDFLEEREDNPNYEILSSYMPYIAARLNHEEGTNYNIDKMINWLFDSDSSVRNGWGIINEKWGDYDVHGLVGSTTDGGGGYAFAMNTFNTAGALTPLVRYDKRYAKAIGKWMLNLTNNSRLFYKNELPKDLQSGTDWKEDSEGVIPYEGIRKAFNDKTPYAGGDPTVYGWGATDFSLYSGSHAGILASIIGKTNVEKILQIDLLKTDYFIDKAYPTYLYYNPYKESKDVKIALPGNETVDIYDTVSETYVLKNVKGEVSFKMAEDSASVIVIVPTGTKINNHNNQLKAGDIVIGYNDASINIGKLQYKDIVKDNLPLDLDISLHKDDKIKELTLSVGNKKVYSGKDLIQSFDLDTTKYSNGFHTLKASLTTEKGLQDKSEVTIFIKNPNSSMVYTADSKKISSWQPIPGMPASVELKDNKALIKEVNENGNWGGVSSETFELDLSRKPMLMVEADSAMANWTIQLHIEGEQWGFYIKPDGGEVGSLTLDMAEKLKRLNADANYTGKQKVELWILAAGKEGAEVNINNINIFYQDEDPMTYDYWSKGFNPLEISKWKSTPSMLGKTYMKDGKAQILKESVGASGGISSPLLEIDFSKNPNINIKVDKLSDNWSLMLYVQGEKQGYYLQKPIDKSGSFNINILKELKKNNPEVKLNKIEKAQFWILAEGPQKATLNIDSIKLSYSKNLIPKFIAAVAISLLSIFYIFKFKK